MSSLPFLTADIPSCGGVFRSSPETFEVEELPAYEPNDEQGTEHLFLWVQKTNRTTQDVARLISRHVGANERDVSWAGLKDRNAVTRQYLCLPAKYAAALETFAVPGVEILKRARHRNKLKTGHLHGNRFVMVLDEVKDVAAARAAFEHVCTRGFPNYFGEQRFGRGGDNAEQGKKILLNGGRHRDRFERKLFLSAYQSELFNRALARRLEAGTFGTALVGDVMKKHETNGEFVCADAAVDQPRVDAFEISPAGPIFGPEMRPAEGVVGEAELKLLMDEDITIDTFRAGRDETKGTRRFYRVPVGNGAFSVDGAKVRLTFELPAGCYATAVIRELLKAE